MSNDLPWTRTICGRPTVGSRAERSRMTSMRDVAMFTEMTGDKNPIHYDAELAVRKGGPGRRDNNRERKGRVRPGRQTDLQAGDHCPQYGR